ncbi:putative ripening-related protein 2, partial [Mucuna pruriens]
MAIKESNNEIIHIAPLQVYTVILYTTFLALFKIKKPNCYVHKLSKRKLVVQFVLNSFEKGGDGNFLSKCENHYHSDYTPWWHFPLDGSTTNAGTSTTLPLVNNGTSVVAMVVEEFDSSKGYVRKMMAINHLVPIKLLMPQWLCKMPYASPRPNGINFISKASFLLLVFLFLTDCLNIEAKKCGPSGRVKGEKTPSGHCNEEDDLCCLPGKVYPTYKCSPPVSSHTKAYLTLNSFQKGGDGNGPSKCDNHYHSDDTPVVALSTGWFNHKSRCLHNITISANGRNVVAMVVDECDSSRGCNKGQNYQPPCANNVVDASMAVWNALGIPKTQWGGMDITWSDA